MGVVKESGAGSVMNIFFLARMVGTLDPSVYHASYGAVRVFTKAVALNGSRV